MEDQPIHPMTYGMLLHKLKKTQEELSDAKLQIKEFMTYVAHTRAELQALKGVAIEGESGKYDTISIM